jgi:hypothetical protein
MKVCFEAHNTYREKFGSKPLDWDAQLSVNATLWAETLLKAERLSRSETEKGESIFRGKAPVKSCQEAVDAWHQEKEKYKGEPITEATEATNYTQMMWKSTTKLGCGMAKNDQNAVYVCQYDPAGNKRDVKLEDS